MSSSNVDKILKILKNKDPMSATSIAHELGYSKASSIKKDLDSLVNDKVIEIDSTGRYDLYKLSSKKSITKTDSSLQSAEKVTVVEGEKVTEKLPEASTSDLRGFSVVAIKFKDKPMKKITTPDGKKIRIENDEKLLVINNEPKYVVKTAEDVITCIRKYALDNNLNVFTVDDIKLNRKISNDKDIAVKDDHIMFLSIKKHNKAA